MGANEEVELDLLATKVELDTWNSREEIHLSSLIAPVIHADDNVSLLELPSTQEVKQALFFIPTDSSPGSDGFGSGFYKACWDIVGTDVMDGVHDFFKGGKIMREFTASFLVLIPKVDNPKSFDKFHPISLCLVFYKICTIILVTQIYIFLASSSPRNSEPSFLGEAFLRIFGFSEGVCNLVSQFISSPWFSIVMNGIPKGFFEGGEMIVASGDKKLIQAISEVLAVYESWHRNILRSSRFSEGSLPFKYLGVSIVSGRLKAMHFDEFLSKIRDKIGSRKSRLLSSSARLLLLKHVLCLYERKVGVNGGYLEKH
ncbi:uncharacterized protein LOC122282173 [Carya illinoinensis]|uniref:uncharacterized protein LOC122282173 n=1 Tax=Carya illinoinensis TaxID=32201 RepID=UPI001C720CFB|nr:uncharacterized protein LOC122282173 [Carya illinoinensis]